MNHRSTYEFNSSNAIEEWKIKLAQDFFLKDLKSNPGQPSPSSNHGDDDVQQASTNIDDEEEFVFLGDEVGERGNETTGLRKRKTILVDQDFVDSIYDHEITAREPRITSSPPSLKCLALASRMNDSGYEGLESGCKSSRVAAKDEEMDAASPSSTNALKSNSPDVENTSPRQKSLEQRTNVDIFLENYLEHILIGFMILCVVWALFMRATLDQDLEYGAVGGKKASILFYHDKMNKNKWF